MVNPLQASFDIRDGPILLCNADRGEYHVRMRGSLGRKEFVHHHNVGGFKCRECLRTIRVGGKNVLANQVQRLDLARRSARDDLPRRHSANPGDKSGELGATAVCAFNKEIHAFGMPECASQVPQRRTE